MKKVIKNKIYDTETARRCGEWDNGRYTSDFGYCSETLYQKKTGEFFLHGKGGAMSSYAKHSGNESSWGEQIMPMTYKEAAEWAEEHLDGDEYIGIFGNPEEDSSRIVIHISIRKDTHDKVKRAAAMTGKTVSEYIEDALNGNL